MYYTFCDCLIQCISHLTLNARHHKSKGGFTHKKSLVWNSLTILWQFDYVHLSHSAFLIALWLNVFSVQTKDCKNNDDDTSPIPSTVEKSSQTSQYGRCHCAPMMSLGAESVQCSGGRRPQTSRTNCKITITPHPDFITSNNWLKAQSLEK